MTDRKGKRAVVINNIKSGSIEQAIFVLRNSAYESGGSAGSAIVAEAQEIINNYISLVEGPIGKKSASRTTLLLIAGAVLGFFIIMAGIISFL